MQCSAVQRQVIAAGHLPLFVLSVVQTHPGAVANCGNVDPVTVAARVLSMRKEFCKGFYESKKLPKNGRERANRSGLGAVEILYS